MKLFIKGGYLLNPATGLEGEYDVLVEDGKVASIEKNLVSDDADQVIEAKGKWVMPGLIDVHVHLREPGFEYKETIETGTKSAARGGFTTVCAMPNTKPATDSVEIVQRICDKAKQVGCVNVLPIGAITVGQKGEELSDIEGMKKAGICALSEDGRSVLNAGLLKKAMIEAKRLGLPVLSHCEDDHLAQGGCMNEGVVSRRLGLTGIPDEAEEVIVARDIILAEKTGAKLHICHTSTVGSAQLIKAAKEKGQAVTAEVAPHHFTLTEEAVNGSNPNTKMNPPLRTAKDVQAMKEALRDGIIDMIATDHAPHHVDEKTGPYEKAANGIVGLETSVALTITELVAQGYLTSMQMAEKMSYNPAKLLGIDKGDISVGHVADIVIIDPEQEYVVEASKLASKSHNTPFDGWKVKGKVLYTIVEGEVRYDWRTE